MITSFVFRVRNIPAALYKAMGGFATNGVNMIKLESYMVGGPVRGDQFYAEVEGHPKTRSPAPWRSCATSPRRSTSSGHIRPTRCARTRGRPPNRRGAADRSH